MTRDFNEVIDAFNEWYATMPRLSGDELRVAKTAFAAGYAKAVLSREDLYDALLGMLAFFSPKPGQGVVIDCVVRAKAAIAKADGTL